MDTRKRDREEETEAGEQAMHQKVESKGIRLLSFDGSLFIIAALSQLLILKEIMQRIEEEVELDVTPSPCEYFDLIGGTGIGGRDSVLRNGHSRADGGSRIFAIFFALWHLSVDEAIEAYLSLHEKVFASDAWLNKDAQAAGSLFDCAIRDIASKLDRDVESAMGKKKRASAGCKGFICTLNPENATHPILFCTYRARANRPPDCTVMQALFASIAGPPYLGPLILGLPPTKFISANNRTINPASQVFKEAQEVFGPSQPVACVISLGSGQQDPVSIPTEREADTADWAKLILDAEQIDHDTERRCGAAKDFFFRLNVTHGLEEALSSQQASSIVASHSDQYLRHASISLRVDRLVRVICERQTCVTTERLNSIFGPDGQDETLKAVKDIQEKFDQRTTIEQDDRIHDITAWLSPNYTVHSSLRECRDKREEGTGIWLIESREFRSWMSGDTRMLTLEGIPGGGKTILASIVYDHLKEIHSRDAKNQVFGAFITYGVTTSIDLILSCLLCQIIVTKVGRLASKVETLYNRRIEGQPNRKEILEALRVEFDQVSPVWVVLDALDEFPSKDRQELLNTLFDLSPSIRLFVTTRPIGRTAPREITHTCLPMDASKKSDLECFVRSKMRRDNRLSTLLYGRTELYSKVMETVLERCNGMFLLAHFHMEELATYRTPVALENALSSLPTTASAKYDITLDRIKQQPGRDGMYALHTLMWMSLGESWSVTQVALAVASSTNELGESGGTALSERDLVDVCSGLLVIIEGRPSFVHLTAQEYFEFHFNKVNSPHFLDVQYSLAAGCLRYICAPHPRATVSRWLSLFLKSSYSWTWNDDAAGFFNYCARNWERHIQLLKYNGVLSFQLFSQVLQFFFPDITLPDTEHKISKSYDNDLELLRVVRRASLAWLASDYSQLLLATQIKNGNILSAVDSANHRLVQLILSCPNSEMTLNIHDGSGRSPLSYAANNGYQDVVKLLLSRSDVEADTRDVKGRSPLSFAARRGHETVAKLLLSRTDVEADSRDEDGRSPLSFAALYGQESVVKLLLSRPDVEADSRTIWGGSPLSFAAREGHETVAKLLFSLPDVEADSRDHYEQSPLSWAAKNGHESVVKLLLSRPDVEADSRDRLGRSLLSCAAENGHESVVKLLLSRPDVEPDSRDEDGKSPLLFAAENGHKNVVKLLLSRPDVEPDSRDNDGRSPLSWAADYGRESVVKLLLSRPDVEADSRDEWGRSPLSYAAENGHKNVVKLLLSRLDVESDSRDEDRRSPLSYAAENGHENVVKLLLSRPDVEADSRATCGQSPLSWAAGKGRESVVKLLLSRPDVEADSRDNDGRSPLSWAADYGYVRVVVKLLLDRTDVEADSRDEFGRSPLSYAAESECKDAVELFLSRPDVEAHSRDKIGRSPLDYAQVMGNYGVFDLLRVHIFGAASSEQASSDGTGSQSAGDDDSSKMLFGFI